MWIYNVLNYFNESQVYAHQNKMLGFKRKTSVELAECFSSVTKENHSEVKENHSDQQGTRFQPLGINLLNVEHTVCKLKKQTAVVDTVSSQLHTVKLRAVLSLPEMLMHSKNCLIILSF